ncbi:glycosyltransferase family 4 protein [Haloarcula marina]|uniref:glycosyltransferase family 4 protein n=1 Tax=Haloarcula marina TaxID=2961574 RepID=UPI0020B7A2A8|nr:glycosyltransferase family 4 protein [Halomicroarcula marina]
MNVLQVTPTHVYPPTTGGQHRHHGIVSAYPDCGDTVTRFAQGGPTQKLLPFGHRDRLRIREGYVERRDCGLLAIGAKLPMLAGQPNVFQNAALSLRPPSWVRDAAGEADLVQVEGPWQLPTVAEFVPESTPLVFSSHNVEYDLFAADADGLVDEWFLDRLATLERRALDAADVLVCTTERDREGFDSRYGIDCPTVHAPNGTGRETLRETPAIDADDGSVRRRHGIAPESTVALFVGTGHRPNVESVRRLVEQFRSEPALDDTHLLVVGTVCDAIGDAPENVTLAGFVDAIEPYYDATDVALNPITNGSGSNIKLLDYLARGLPVVSTPFGTRGFDVVDGEHLVVADADAVPGAIARLGANAELRAALGRAGLELVAERYTWDCISERLRGELARYFE